MKAFLRFFLCAALLSVSFPPSALARKRRDNGDPSNAPPDPGIQFSGGKSVAEAGEAGQNPAAAFDGAQYQSYTGDPTYAAGANTSGSQSSPGGGSTYNPYNPNGLPYIGNPNGLPMYPTAPASPAAGPAGGSSGGSSGSSSGVDRGAAMGGATGALIGALIGAIFGPVGIIIGIIIGALIGMAIGKASHKS